MKKSSIQVALSSKSFFRAYPRCCSYSSILYQFLFIVNSKIVRTIVDIHIRHHQRHRLRVFEINCSRRKDHFSFWVALRLDQSYQWIRVHRNNRCRNVRCHDLRSCLLEEDKEKSDDDRVRDPETNSYQRRCIYIWLECQFWIILTSGFQLLIFETSELSTCQSDLWSLCLYVVNISIIINVNDYYQWIFHDH